MTFALGTQIHIYPNTCLAYSVLNNFKLSESSFEALTDTVIHYQDSHSAVRSVSVLAARVLVLTCPEHGTRKKAGTGAGTQGGATMV